MGKSDGIIFETYLSVLEGSFSSDPQSIAFLGFSEENDFTKKLPAPKRHFYDLKLKNWHINNEYWMLEQTYDLIVCTRCAYFSRNGQEFIKKIESFLNPGGQALIDWGLGDHWRFEKYKVGWVRDGEHEYAYLKDNFLYSCFWNDDLLEHNDVNFFWEEIRENKNFGYKNDDNLKNIILKEVPSVVSYKTKKIVTKFLWKDSPQLYIVTLFEKEKDEKI